MAISNFIPTVWSEALCQSLDKAYIGVAHCTREFDGDIKEKGNTVKICGLNSVNVYDYLKNSNMRSAEVLSDFSTDLVINYAKYFNFQIDDVDRAQTNPKLMQLALKNAANALAAEADRIVFETCAAAENTYHATASKSAVIHDLIYACTLLREISGGNFNDFVLEVSPSVAALIIEAKLNLASDNTELMENGCIGSISGCKVFASSQIPLGEDENCNPVHRCILRSTRAVAFAEQLSEIQAYRPELRFADAVKGLHLYGCKIVRPQEIMVVNFAFPTEA